MVYSKPIKSSVFQGGKGRKLFGLQNCYYQKFSGFDNNLIGITTFAAYQQEKCK